jgi:PHD/YefM family antitoxin component YafN of YafNO toxin-antitoxin module
MVFKLLIKQMPDLLYKKVDDKYYITNMVRKEVVVVNESAFRILELSDNKTVDEITAVVKDDIGMTDEEVREFLKQLSSAGLLESPV